MPSRFPKQIDVVLPIIDGFHPITPEDRNLKFDAVEKVQEILGYGVSATTGGTVYGPKGSLASAAERLDKLLDPDGSMIDMDIISGKTRAAEFTDIAGHDGFYIPFSKDISGTGMGAKSYVVLMTFMPHHVGSTYPDAPSEKAPLRYYIAQRFPAGCYIKARQWHPLRDIKSDDGREVSWMALVVGPKAYGFVS